MRPKQQVETFPDGVVDVYAPETGRKVGALKATLRFEKQSVGVNRFYEAGSLNGNRVDQTIKVPHTGKVDRLDIAVIRSSGRQYRINRIQEKPERGVDIWELQSVQVTITKEE